MVFATGTASSMANLITAIDTHLVTTAGGWTSNQLDTGAGKAAWSRDNIFVSVRWDTGSPNFLGIYQALGFSGTGTDPGNHTDDSGNGAISGTDTVIDDQRSVQLGAGPYTYWFFEFNTYMHIVVESSANDFKHFGWGTLTKSGSWTGGEYAYGQSKTATNPINSINTHLLDGFYHATNDDAKRKAATLHVEGLPNEGGSSKWGQVWGSTTTPPLDRNSNAKVVIQGGFRCGPTATQFGKFSAGSNDGGIPMYPIECYYQDVSNSRVYYLGYMPDVRGVNIRYFAPRDVVTIGGDDWYFFPSRQKSVGNGATTTNNQGIAYRREDG